MEQRLKSEASLAVDSEKLLSEVILETGQLLTEFAQRNQFLTKVETAFGTGYDADLVENLQQTLLSGEFFNAIEIAVLPSSDLNGALGAYAGASNTIYLSRELLTSSPEQASAVLLEEVGHAIDARLNETDSAGDEGAIFSALVRGVSEQASFPELTQENDHADLKIDGETVAVEQAEFPAEFELSNLDGSNGFTLNGANEDDFSGEAVSSAGDINGDGIDDLIIAADRADPNGKDNAGESHVVFGSSSGFSSTVELSNLNGSNGFTLNGANERDFLGHAVSSAGDINGDGLDDLIIGADNADPNGKERAGESYVVFGRDTSSGNASPQVETSLSNQSATTGESFSFQIPSDTFSDSDGDSLTYSASPQNGNSLPDWLSFNANNRTFSGTPTADDAGTLNLEITATDPNGATASSNFSLNVGTETISISDATFEFLAKDVAYDNQKEGERFTVEGTEYEIDRVFNDQATGFYALGLKTVNRNNSILALGGTETDKFSDILNDLHPKGIGFNQFKANWLSSNPNTDVKSWLNNQQTPDLTGHSLGGALSQWIAADYTSQTPQPNSSLGQIVTFNSPGIASNSSNVPVSATDYNPELAQSVEHYVTDGDAVSLAGDQFISGQGTLSSFIEPNPSITLGLVNRHLRPVETEQAVFGLEKPSFLFNQQSFDIENLNLVDLRSFAANAIELPGSPWGIKEPEFEIEAAKNSIRVSGGATLAIPSGVNVGGV